MKEFLLIFSIFALSVTVSKAQIKRNSFLVRTSVQHHEFTSSSVNFIGGDFGYFIANNFAIGYHHAFVLNPFEFYQPGFFGRYYYKEKLIFGAGYKTIKIETVDSHLRWHLGLNAELGYSYSIKKILAIDCLLNYNAADRKSYGISFGGTFFFNRRESRG